MRKQKRFTPAAPAGPITTAVDGTVIGRIDDLQKAFTDMRNTYDLSERGASFIQAAMIGLKQNQSSANFGPGVPNLPLQPEDQPRQFAYTPGTNLTWIPRSGYGLIDYPTLRALSFASKEMRLNFELVKRTLRGLGHEITQAEKTVDSYGKTYKAVPPNYAEVLAFWKKPDGFHNFDDWVDIILEDALVVGTSAIFKTPDPAQEQCAQPIDATTWRILTDMAGRIPPHPMPAFIQTTYGRASYWCSRRHLTYSPLHPTVNNPYGYSATEFIIQALVQSIKRDSSRTGAFTDGNVPAAFVGLPTAWSPQQIKDFTEWFNALVQGDVNRMNKIMFIPHDGQGIPVSPFSSIDQNQTGLDEWLLKVAAWAVGNSPSEFGLTNGTGLGGKGALDAGENAQYRGSTAVYTQYISRIVEDISHEYLNAPWVKSTWQGLQTAEDDLKIAQVETARIASGVWSVAYVQDQLGYDRKKYGESQPATPTPPQAGQGAVSGANLIQAPGTQPETTGAQEAPTGQAESAAANPADNFKATKPPVKLPPNFGKIAARAAEADLFAWRDKARFSLSKGLGMPVFKTECIPGGLQEVIRNGLAKEGGDRAGIDRVFDHALSEVRDYGVDLELQHEPLEKADGRRQLIETTLAAIEALEALERE